MFNAYPLNTVPLNGLAVTDAAEPVPVVQGGSFAWSLVLYLGGEDYTDRLTGALRVMRAEDGDSVFSFALWLGPDPVDVAAFTGAPVYMDFVVQGDPQVSVRRFTGYLVQPEFDVLSRVLVCEATTRLAASVEAMEFDAIDLLVGGWWSADVFEAREGRSRWDYAQERLSTRAASLNVTMQGAPRITPWHPAGISYSFGPGTTVYQSLDVALASLVDTVNVVELELDYRYSRYRQRSQNYTWRHPANTFEFWRMDSTELPDIPMVIEAVESAGWFVTSAAWYRLPGDLPDLPSPWYNKNTDLLLGCDVGASLRWSQRVIEAYRLRVEVTAAVDAVGEVIKRNRVVLDTDTDTDRIWESTRFGVATEAGDDPVDALPRRDQVRLDAAVSTALRRASVELLSAQRGNRVTWQVPLAHALGVDLGQRLSLSDEASITGTVVELNDDLDIETGAALLTITLAVSRGASAAVADPLVVPAAPEFVDDFSPGVTVAQPTQLGLRADSPLYDPELPGFAGPYSIGNGDPALRYPRRFALDTPEIPAQWRDENTAEQLVVYRVAPPVDELEI
ncbi:MAG: hypothetical protein CVV07_07410 [Gammaproteobacteria bacterium HGW-Gammaproteobacteria-11]|nr:MAG: hypothetical protein CVV07_07410 [Gammaproteobacteria bacterium HGW-Gammaproteobacteria-11]